MHVDLLCVAFSASAPVPSSGRGSSGGRGELYAGAYSGPPNSYEMRSNKV